jgi:hypothetical protein
MRALGAGALAAVVPVAYLAILAALSARQLTTLDPRRQPAPDPLLTILETLGLLVALAAFAGIPRGPSHAEASADRHLRSDV